MRTQSEVKTCLSLTFDWLILKYQMHHVPPTSKLVAVHRILAACGMKSIAPYMQITTRSHETEQSLAIITSKSPKLVSHSKRETKQHFATREKFIFGKKKTSVHWKARHCMTSMPQQKYSNSWNLFLKPFETSMPLHRICTRNRSHSISWGSWTIRNLNSCNKDNVMWVLQKWWNKNNVNILRCRNFFKHIIFPTCSMFNLNEGGFEPRLYVGENRPSVPWLRLKRM